MPIPFGRSFAGAFLLLALLVSSTVAQPASAQSAPADSLQQQRPTLTVLPNIF